MMKSILTQFFFCAFILGFNQANAQSGGAATLTSKQQLTEKFWVAYMNVMKEQDPFRRGLASYAQSFPDDPNIKLATDPRVIEKFNVEMKRRFFTTMEKNFSETDLKYLIQLFESNLLKKLDTHERQIWDKNELAALIKSTLAEVAAIKPPAPATAPAPAAAPSKPTAAPAPAPKK